MSKPKSDIDRMKAFTTTLHGWSINFLFIGLVLTVLYLPCWRIPVIAIIAVAYAGLLRLGISVVESQISSSEEREQTETKDFQNDEVTP